MKVYFLLPFPNCRLACVFLSPQFFHLVSFYKKWFYLLMCLQYWHNSPQGDLIKNFWLSLKWNLRSSRRPESEFKRVCLFGWRMLYPKSTWNHLVQSFNINNVWTDDGEDGLSSVLVTPVPTYRVCCNTQASRLHSTLPRIQAGWVLET